MLVTAMRHAESLGNAGLLLVDDPDPRLSPRGVEQARLSAERLAQEGVTHMWSSPFRRAVQTASILAEEHGIEILLEAGMCEHYIYDDLRDWHPTTGREIAGEFGRVRLPRGFDAKAWTPEWGETWEALLVRTARVARKALALGRRSRGERDVHLVVVGHGASTKGLLSALTGIGIAQDAPFVNAGMSRVRVTDSLPGEIVFLNDASHLSGLDENL